MWLKVRPIGGLVSTVKNADIQYQKGISVSSEYVRCFDGKPYAEDACLLGYCGVL
jgi:hypothetical protein